MEFVEATFAVFDPLVRFACSVIGFVSALASLKEDDPFDKRAYRMAAAAFFMVLANA